MVENTANRTSTYKESKVQIRHFQRKFGIANLALSVVLNAALAGIEHVCAVYVDLIDGANYYKIKCWGWNSKGQLGLGDTNQWGDEPDEVGDQLPWVDLGTGRTAITVSAGGEFSCAVMDNGIIKCWGKNDKGQLGYA
eukprot:589348-Prorocentrum_minimum.AAC.3